MGVLGINIQCMYIMCVHICVYVVNQISRLDVSLINSYITAITITYYLRLDVCAIMRSGWARNDNYVNDMQPCIIYNTIL